MANLKKEEEIQILESLMKSKNYDEVIHKCDISIYKKDIEIVVLKLKALRKLKRYSDILDICSEEEFQPNDKIQAQLSKSYLEQNILLKALKICKQEIFVHSDILQSQLIGILMLQKKYSDALEICEREEFLSDATIQSQRITILMRLDRLEEALKICNDKNFLNSASIQSHKVAIYIKQNNLNDALKICKRDIFSDNEWIQSQQITILMDPRINNLDDALEISEREEFKLNIPIQTQRITILMKKKRIAEALDIYMNLNNRKKLRLMREDKNILDCIIKKKTVTELLTRIYINDVDEELINNSRISVWYKELLLLAYYEKNNKVKCISFIKELRYKYPEDEFKLRILNKILSELDNKKNRIFNIGKYEKFLKAKVDFNLIETLQGNDNKTYIKKIKK